MAEFILSAFADEITPDFDGQLEALKKLNIPLLELRGVDGKSFTQLTDAEVSAVGGKLKKAGIGLSALGAYGLARSRNRLSNSLQGISMAVMMIPGTALLVGTYSLMVKFGMTNTLYGLALLSAAGGIPATMFMYMNFVVSIPTALDEAAAIDGAGVLRTFVQIIMPQLKAVTITRIIMSATGSWNNYMMPMYLLQNKSKFTIILVIKSAFNRTNGVGNMPKACATCAIGLLPVIVLYLFLQKYIIEGQIDSSVK